MSLIPHFTAAATVLAGGVDLCRYPGLAYAPAQYGEGVRFARNGRPVQDLPGSPAARAASAQLDALASAFGVPFADVLDAMKYLRDSQQI